MTTSPRERLAAFARTTGVELPLAECALLIAAEEYPDLDVPRYLGLLDHLAENARSRMPAGSDPEAAVVALCAFLARDAGFRGNNKDYDDPRNSYLNEVLELRHGTPISLAVVHLEVGWRLHLPLYGVGMPAHFLVGCETPGEPLFIDAFNGTVLSPIECQELFMRLTGDSIPFRRQYLASTPRREILIRILRNLKNAFLKRRDIDRAAAAIERMLLLAPDLSGDVRDLGLLRWRQGRLRDAGALLEQYLRSVAKDSADRPGVETSLRQIRELLSRLN